MLLEFNKGYGVTFVPGILVLTKSAATSALGLPTSFILENKKANHPLHSLT